MATRKNRNTKKTTPKAAAKPAVASTPGSPAYLEALDSIQGGKMATLKSNLQDQVSKGWITQAAADAEYSKQLEGTRGKGLDSGLKSMAGGDGAIEKGFQGGAEIANALFAPGSLGRVSETASADQNAIDARLKGLSEPDVDPTLRGFLDRANATATSAQTLDPELQNVLNTRKSALGGLSSSELLATKEMAQAGFNQSLGSAVRALRIGQGGSGPGGRASNIAAMPLTAQYANSQADLQRKLVLDQYKAQTDARDAYSRDAQGIIGGFQANQIAANNAAGAAASTVLNDRTTRFNNYIQYNTGLRNDLYNRQLQNLNAIAAEKSGQSAAIFGGGAFAAQQQGADQSFELGKQNLDLQNKIYSRNNSGGGSSGGSQNSPGGSSTAVGEGDSDVFG